MEDWAERLETRIFYTLKEILIIQSNNNYQKLMRNYHKLSTLPTKVHLVKAMVFPVVMYGFRLDCEESWMPKNWWFWTVVLEKTLESPLDCKEIQPVHSKGDESCSLEGMMLKLKLQYFGHLMRRVDSLEKTLMLGGPGGRRRRG